MNKEMKIAVILNYIHILVANLSSVILTPIIIRGLGMEQYGLYVLVFTTILYVYVAEFSIGNIVVSYVAKYRALNDKPGEKGCSLFIYNDFGGHGGFAEYEHSGLTLGMDTGKNESACELTDWWFISDKANIEAIVWMLLGIKYAILF